MKTSMMKMFDGKINGVEFDDENLYNSVVFLLLLIEGKFGEVYNNEFIEELKLTIETMYLKYEEFSYADLKNEFSRCIKDANTFNEIKFNYFGNDWKIEDLNQNILSEMYYKEKINFYKKNIKEAVMKAIFINGLVLRFVPLEFKKDKEVVLIAVRQNGLALEYASKELQDDKEIVLTAVKENGWALKYVSEKLQNDREIVMEAIKQNGNALKWASKELKNDKEFILKVVMENKTALKYVSKELKKDKEIKKFILIKKK